MVLVVLSPMEYAARFLAPLVPLMAVGATLGDAPEVQDDIEGSVESEDESEEDDETQKTPEEPTPATTPSEE